MGAAPPVMVSGENETLPVGPMSLGGGRGQSYHRLWGKQRGSEEAITPKTPLAPLPLTLHSLQQL